MKDKGKILLIFALLLTLGCSAASVVPTTYGEVKRLIVSKEKVFYADLNHTLGATVITLMNAGFTINQIAHFSGRGKVEAVAKGINVKVTLYEITPKMTKVCAKVTRESVLSREFAVEEGLFDVISKWLENPDALKNWRKATVGMLPVYYEMDESSKVVGYLRPGTPVEVAEKREGWAKVKLLEGGYGYVRWYKKTKK